MPTKEQLAIFTGLLDFYSDRATAHASFLVAGTFGIYSVLFAQENVKLPSSIFCATFFALAAMCIYSFLNFGYYATMAENMRLRLMGAQSAKIDAEIRDYLKKKFWIFSKFRSAKHTPFKGLVRYFGFFIIWLFAVIVPFCWMLLFHT